MTCGNDRTESAQFEYISQFLFGSLRCMAFSAATCWMPPPSTSTLFTWLFLLVPIKKKKKRKKACRQDGWQSAFHKLWYVCRMNITIVPLCDARLSWPLLQSTWVMGKKRTQRRVLSHSLYWLLSLTWKQWIRKRKKTKKCHRQKLINILSTWCLDHSTLKNKQTI